MHVRRLSPSSLWIEMPLSVESSPLVWRAMAAAGLNSGKINSHNSIYFEHEIPGHKHLVEGLTASGLFRDNSRIVVELSPENDGTRLDIGIERTDGGIDLTGRSRKLRRHYTQEIEGFLTDLPDYPNAEEPISAPPIASPYAGGAAVRFVEAQNQFILPIHRPSKWSFRSSWQNLKETWKTRLLYGVVGIATFWLCNKFDLWGFLFLGLAAFEVWSSKKYHVKLHWGSLCFFLFLGGFRTWVFLHRWI
ncbi:hypothetical protein EON83_05650 [bacterium]|nr:MAG: hypothetical protein EON83_05650 [bacterium]